VVVAFVNYANRAMRLAVVMGFARADKLVYDAQLLAGCTCSGGLDREDNMEVFYDKVIHNSRAPYGKSDC
jgi:hypothetical protein